MIGVTMNSYKKDKDKKKNLNVAEPFGFFYSIHSALFFLVKTDANITHDATRDPTVRSAILVS